MKLQVIFFCSSLFQTVYSEELGSLAGDKQLFIPSGFYKGCKVAIKRINEKNIHLNREQMLELKKVSFETMQNYSIFLCHQ